MKTALRSACVAVLVLLLGATASPAVAKGPTDVRVSGPGVDVRLGYHDGSGGNDLGTLAEAARVYDILGDPVLAEAPGLAPAQLGPRYVLDWSAGGAGLLVQHAYPFAEGGAWVRFLPTESGWGSGTSGWAQAPALTDRLVALGAVAEATEPSTAPVSGDTELAATPRSRPPADGSDGRPPYEVVVPAGLALLVVLSACLVVARRRAVSR